MIHQMRAEQDTYLIQGNIKRFCPCGTVLEVLAFSPLIKRKYYLITLADYSGIWIMYDPLPSGIWSVT